MDVTVRLGDLTVMHPRLLWEEIAPAAAAVLGSAGTPAPFQFELAVNDMPHFDGRAIRLVSDMLVTVKSREVQRGMLAEMSGDQGHATRHFLAAAHLELVLANDYAQAGQDEMALRSRMSAASCFWRAGEVEPARALFDDLVQDDPARADTIREAIAELEDEHPKLDDRK